MPQVSLGSQSASVVDLSQYALKTTNVFSGVQTLQAGATIQGATSLQPSTDVVGLILRAMATSGTQSVLQIRPITGTGFNLWDVSPSGALLIQPGASKPAFSAGVVISVPGSTVASATSIGASTMTTYTPPPSGIAGQSITIDTGGQQESATVLSVSGNTITFTGTLTKTHAQGVWIAYAGGGVGGDALQLNANPAGGGSCLKWVDTSNTQQGRITNSGAMHVLTTGSVFGSLSPPANTVVSALATGTGIIAFRARRNASGTTADIVTVEDESGSALSRFNKAGRFTTKVATAPALGDLADGDLALSTDASGNLIVTSRISGALKTATVTTA
jgi:hypothetical protein